MNDITTDILIAVMIRESAAVSDDERRHCAADRELVTLLNKPLAHASKGECVACLALRILATSYGIQL